MKKIITVMLCIVVVLRFAGSGKDGDTSKVEIDYGTSSVYSKEEIDSAIEIIKKQFASFKGCELHSLSYMPDEESNNADVGTMVWIPATGEKYHSIPNCGRMNPDTARQVSRSEAEVMGYGPCSKCY